MSRVIVLNNIINFEPEKKCIYSSESHVQISTPASYCFQLLIEKQGELVSHDELYQYAWRQFGMEATANTLYQNISIIRRSLDACGLHQDIIRTMPRRGFILSPAVEIFHKRTRDLTSEIELVKEETSDYLEVNQHVDVSKNSPDDRNKGEFQILRDSVSKLDIVPETHQSEDRILSETLPDRESWHNAVPLLNKLFSNTFINSTTLGNSILVGLVIAALASVIYLIVDLNINQHLKNINYVYLSSEKGCDYFINRDGEDDQRSIKLLSTLQKQCLFGKYVYLTKYTEGGFISIISCKKPLSYLDGTLCISEYINSENGGKND
ncbi:winged helix-turn-helix domain-containing protein [Rosenbergiella epipactidis]|uniref:winged helix-turn-helix domain-containing protein n=1 Tax=Rosenbergiella epipactidis TaxID=1544694 RepID=UPI001F4EA0A8|nr:winged helix-turn-helix domain-containing protein [Rosenbergiella epipactidis]